MQNKFQNIIVYIGFITLINISWCCLRINFFTRSWSWRWIFNTDYYCWWTWWSWSWTIIITAWIDGYINLVYFTKYWFAWLTNNTLSDGSIYWTATIKFRYAVIINANRSKNNNFYMSNSIVDKLFNIIKQEGQ